MLKHRLMLTVDVEAQLRRAKEDHVNRLIWGKFDAGTAGIREMMTVAEDHSVKLTMFLDWAELDIHGEAISEVAREIYDRGHDLQLHLHNDFFSSEFWAKNKIHRELDLNRLSLEQANVIADEICARQLQVTGVPAIAFRGGGYRFSKNLLTALAKNGVKLDSSLNVTRDTQPVDLNICSQFKWSNGMIEIPVSTVSGFANCLRPLDFNFNTSNFPTGRSMVEYLDVFWNELGDSAVANLVLHSWSMLKLNKNGHFEYVNNDNIKKFRDFLSLMKENVEIVTSEDLVNMERSGELFLDPPVDLELFSEAMARKADARTGEPIPYLVGADKMKTAGYTSLSCPICGTGKSRFVEMGGRLCPECGSVERQRILAVAYNNGLRQRFEVMGKSVLIFSPAVSELRFLRDVGLVEKISVDIRPDVKPDILADMCSMPQIADDSQDFVFASYLMPVVYDMGAALDEVQRVLAPGGAFISCEPLQQGITKEVDDPNAVSNWYGKEALEKYRVGSFRILGEVSFLEELKRRFSVERFKARDPITGQVNFVHLCWSNKTVLTPKSNHRRPTCTICLSFIPNPSQDDNCPICLARPKTRTLPELVSRFVKVKLVNLLRPDVLAFNPSRAEVTFLNSTFSNVQSASQFGDFGSKNLSGVDLANMPQISDASWSAICATGVFELTSDQSAAAGECFRILKPGGVLFAQFSESSLSDGESPPQPSGHAVPVGHGSDASLQPHLAGRQWIIKNLTGAGFDVRHEKISDPITQKVFDWFIAYKPSHADTLLSTDLDSTPVRGMKLMNTDVDAKFELAESLWNETENPNSQKECVRILTELFQAGNRARSAYRLGTAHYYGRGTESDLEKAFDFFRLPELDDTRFAWYYRGRILSSKMFAGSDDILAKKALRIALDRGVAIAEAPLSALLRRTSCPVCGQEAASVATSDSKCSKCDSNSAQRAFCLGYEANIGKSVVLMGKGLFQLGGKSETIKVLQKAGIDAEKIDFSTEDDLKKVMEFSSIGKHHYDFACLARINKETINFEDVSLLKECIKIGGYVIFVSEKEANLVDMFIKHFQVNSFLVTDPVSLVEFDICVARRVSLEFLLGEHKKDKQIARKYADENRKNELAANCEFSVRYEAFKQKNAETTYAQFAVAIEAEMVAANGAHATLGLNVTSSTLTDGKQTFEKYKDILQVGSEDRVVEYGCGSLRVGAGFIEFLKPQHFYGLDVVDTFYKLGVSRLGEKRILEKSVRFDVIGQSGVSSASNFGADHVYATAVIFHIHPDDILSAMENLSALASKPGAKLIFDAKVTRESVPQRYAQKDGKGGWAWPLEFYRSALAPLKLVAVHDRRTYDYFPGVDYAHLEFHMPTGLNPF